MAAVGGSAKELLKYVPLKTTYKRVSVVRNLTHLPHFFCPLQIRYSDIIRMEKCSNADPITVKLEVA